MTLLEGISFLQDSARFHCSANVSADALRPCNSNVGLVCVFLKSNRYATKQQKAMLKLFLDYAALNSNPVTSMQVKDIKNEESVDSENSGDNVDSVESGESGENGKSG